MKPTRRFAALLLLLLAGLGLAAGLVHKGRVFLVDAQFNQGFEEEGWNLGWTLVDGDGSGTGWQRLSLDEYYEPFGGDWSLGCRYNGDGSPNDDWLITPPLRADSARTTLTIHYRSQDVNHLEHIRIYSLESNDPVDFSGLGSAELEALFSLELDNSRVPTSWQTWELEVPADTTVIHHFAVRCVSQDRFVLLVDGFGGLNTVASGNYYVESRFRPHPLGAVAADSFLLNPLRIWNLSGTDSLWLVPRFADTPFGNALDPPFFIDDLLADTVMVLPEAKLDLQTGLQGEWETDEGTTLRYAGSQRDTLLVDWSTGRDGPWSTDTLLLTGMLWAPDSLALYFWSEGFTGGHLDSLSGWTRGQPALSPGWQIGEFVSSLNFTVPWREGKGAFAYINSDAQGLWRADGVTPAVQDDTLSTPMLAVPQSEALTLGYELYYDDGGGARLQLLAREPGSAWQLLDEPAGDRLGWTVQALGLGDWLEADSLQLAFVYQGSWSYGVAIDNLVLQAGTEGLQSPEPPAPQPQPQPVSASISPNPFNPVTVLHYEAPGAGVLRWRVYNLQGRLVLDSGRQRVWRGDNVFTLDLGRSAAGLYLIRLEGGDAAGGWPTLTRKMTLLK